jgi:hypothetical protein
MRAKLTPKRVKGSAGDRYLHAILLLTDSGRQAETPDVAEKVGATPAAASNDGSAPGAHRQAVINLVQAQANRYADTAALFQAPGGGWWNRPEITQN